MTFAGKTVLVVGLGASGWAASRALIDLGADVRAIESNESSEMQERAAWLRAHGATADLGNHDLAELDADIAVASPGIPPTAPIMKALEVVGIPVISEIELAYQLAECEFLAVTGTNGKTTTTSLLAAMLERSGVRSLAAGNIGLPLIDAIERVGKGGAIAVEVSSFQLASIDEFRPKVAVLLNIAEDHTDWHGSMEEYARAKARIAENQKAEDFFVVNRDDPETMKLSTSVHSQVVPFSTLTAPPDGLGIDDGDVRWRSETVFDSADIRLSGRAGAEDTLAAAAAALSYGIDARHVIEAIRGFVPLRHRMEDVARMDGVRYIDDSKATNPHATLAAVSGLTDVVLIAGGRSKGIDLSVLAQTVPPVIAVVALGEAAEDIASVFEGLVPVDRASSMAEAVMSARARSVPGG
ncbi:MAG: UDP-N-acetylmuramoyl-L-alanine--D-glutamate ligase, partial [Actinobacteria bacterium]|nr:UDP-N-acetylmuramoyl-L-alanine--D-glutamate ligase [Actinomycetota bacterium]